MPTFTLTKSAEPECEVVHRVFAIKTVADPQALLRVANLFAQRGILPRQLSCQTVDEILLIDVEVALENAAVADLILQKLRALVLVQRACLVGSAS